MGKRLIRPGDEFTAELPYSEVCMHLNVAGSRMRGRLLATGMVQLLNPDGSQFSIPITAGEAGLDYHDRDHWLVTVDGDPERPVEDPAEAAAAGQDRARLVLAAISEPLAVPDPHTWRGEVIDGPAGPLYWHPDLGYVPVPEDGP